MQGLQRVLEQKSVEASAKGLSAGVFKVILFFLILKRPHISRIH